MVTQKASIITISPYVSDLPIFMIIPVTPSVISVDNPQGVRKDIIVNVGEVADIGVRKPDMVSFSSFFPQHQDTYTNFNFHIEPIQSPMDWVNRFLLLKDSFFKLTISGLGINGLYILDDNFSYKIVGGVGYDIEYSAKFIKYQPISIRNTNVNEEAALEVNNIRNVFSSRNKGESYTVKINDTWSSISNKYNISSNELRLYNHKINIFDLIVGDIIFTPSSRALGLSISNFNPIVVT